MKKRSDSSGTLVKQYHLNIYFQITLFDEGHSQQLLMDKRGLFDGDLTFITADAAMVNWSEG